LPRFLPLFSEADETTVVLSTYLSLSFCINQLSIEHNSSKDKEATTREKILALDVFKFWGGGVPKQNPNAHVLEKRVGLDVVVGQSPWTKLSDTNIRDKMLEQNTT
jgi:hypothetical protein